LEEASTLPAKELEVENEYVEESVSRSLLAKSVLEERNEIHRESVEER
jgi:hypothetical protein